MVISLSGIRLDWPCSDHDLSRPSTRGDGGAGEAREVMEVRYVSVKNTTNKPWRAMVWTGEAKSIQMLVLNNETGQEQCPASSTAEHLHGYGAKPFIPEWRPPGFWRAKPLSAAFPRAITVQTSSPPATSLCAQLTKTHQSTALKSSPRGQKHTTYRVPFLSHSTDNHKPAPMDN